MSPEIAVAPEHFAAGAVIWLDVGVGEQMSLEIGTLIKATGTDGTFVGRLLHVQDLVYG